MKSKSWMFIACLGSVAVSGLLTGCDAERAQTKSQVLYMGLSIPDTTMATEEVVVVEERVSPVVPPPPAAMTRAGMNVTELAYPTGDKATSIILLRQSAPIEVRANSDFDYLIEVINLTGADLNNVVVNAEGFKNVSFVSSEPPFTRMGQDDGAWLIGDLPARGTKNIRIKAKAGDQGMAANCLSVSYANVLCVATSVVKPAMTLVKTATPEVCSTCEEIKLTYEVKNTGTGFLENVVIKDQLAAGLTTLDGKNMVEIPVGNVPAGASKPFNVTAKATKAGNFASAASATSAPLGLTVQSGNPATVVKEPKVEVSCAAPEKVFIGRDITYTFTVKNSGNCAASSTVVSAPVPAGTTFVSADGGGQNMGGKVNWNVGSLAAGATQTYKMTVKPSGAGAAPVTVTASATCLSASSSNCSTMIAGIPAILLEVVDTVDPVEVGGETTFIVTVTNQGSADDDDIVVVATLPPQMSFINATGPAKVTQNGQVITMGDVDDLFPGQRAEWKLRVKINAPGDVRTSWSMTSKQFSTPPITETEATNLFK
jgi:uncharacterized repeat protein (TIGR01451 family)